MCVVMLSSVRIYIYSCGCLKSDFCVLHRYTVYHNSFDNSLALNLLEGFIHLQS